MTRLDITISQLVVAWGPHCAPAHCRISPTLFTCKWEVKLKRKPTATRSAHFTHKQTRVSTRGARVWSHWSCWDCCQIHLRMRPRWRTFKWQHQGSPGNITSLNWARAGERMPRVIKGYTDTALTAPCCRGGDVFRDKKGEIASEGFISTAIIPDPGTERRKPRERQAGRRWGGERREEKRGEREYQRWREEPWYNSKLINEEAVRWNEEEIEEEAKAESCSLIFRSGETLCTGSCSRHSDSHLFP